MKKVYIETYGCSNNKAESQIMAGVLDRAGFMLADEKDADIVVVNTCSVKNKTENKIMHRLAEISSSGKKLVIAGCLPEADLQRVRKFNASVVGTNHIDRIAEAAASEQTLVFTGKAKIEKAGLPKISNGIVDIVPIASGCVSFCSFCSTKLAKGNVFSYSEDAIINSIKSSKIGGGAREFWLTGQDCGCYGFDTNTNIAHLLNNITSSVSGTYFVRMGMASPQHVKKILPVLAKAYESSNVFKFLHVPVQSGSDSVLRKMQRGHTVEDFTFVVNEFRKQFPQISIWTDIIVGFPGETGDDFQKSLKLLREIKPDITNVSAFSSRRGTKAAHMDKIQTDVVKERTRILGMEAKKIALEQNRKWIGWSGEILIDELKQEKNSFIGRNFAYKPVALKDHCELGQIADVEIVGAGASCLFGEKI